MNRLFSYIKYISIFITTELLLVFIMSIINLFGVKNAITSLILFIANIILFFIISFLNAYKRVKKGLLEGLYIGIILIILLIIIKLIFISNTFNIATYIYYIVLIISSLFGGMLGVNKKSDE